MKRYTIEIVLHEESHEFWDDINKAGKTGCDEVIESVQTALESHGFNVTLIPNYAGEDTIRLKKFEDIE
jgi:hypothetical protein